MTDNIFNRINVEVKRTYYSFDRYKSQSTFVLLYHDKDLTSQELGKFVRISDKFVQIDDNHFFINFVFTCQENAFKASQNLLLYLDNKFKNTSTCIALDNFDTTKTTKMVINRLEQILKETKKHSYGRIEDEDILNELL
ncbi:hypothetical protein [Sulfurimonas sp.]|uniref:hypothetical protein n=1 Tax=Sulfurimonas sp. TaxID=2022749 RepID=UPI002AB22766|nr:hypothetical protein [Sulfurimonas sp.]